MTTTEIILFIFLLIFETVSNVLVWTLPSKSEYENLKRENESLKNEISILMGEKNGIRKN